MEYLNNERVMSYLGKVIWKNAYGYMVANGDGTDKYFETCADAMKYIEDKRGFIVKPWIKSDKEQLLLNTIKEKLDLVDDIDKIDLDLKIYYDEQVMEVKTTI